MRIAGRLMIGSVWVCECVGVWLYREAFEAAYENLNREVVNMMTNADQRNIT